MPAFYILIFLAACLLWFLSSSWFKPFGDFVYRIWKDAKDAMASENKTKNKEGANENE